MVRAHRGRQKSRVISIASVQSLINWLKSMRKSQVVKPVSLMAQEFALLLSSEVTVEVWNMGVFVKGFVRVVRSSDVRTSHIREGQST